MAPLPVRFANTWISVSRELQKAKILKVSREFVLHCPALNALLLASIVQNEKANLLLRNQSSNQYCGRLGVVLRLGHAASAPCRNL